ncbi:MAG: BamA/TamA family outer membrane protein [Candidatus Zixiibacteriota bacterium]
MNTIFRFSFVLILTSLLAELAFSQNNFEVRSLEFVGNQVISDDDLRLQMATYATGGFAKTILGKESFLYSEDILANDLEAIVRYYQKEGFLYAKAVLADLDTDAKDRTVRITIRVDEGDSISVGKVSLVKPDSLAALGSQIAALVDKVSLELKARTGKRFRDADVDADRMALGRALDDAGFPFSQIIPNLEVNEPQRTVDITWTVVPGPHSRFGEITVIGNDNVSEALIRKYLAFSSGDEYSRKDLEESQRRIYNLSLFHVATVTARLTSTQDSIVPVEVRVKEAPRFTTRIGFGYGREEKIRVYSDSYVLGVFGGARRINLYAKHSDIEPYHVSLKHIQPAFLTINTRLEINPFILRQEEPGFTENRYGGNVSALHEFSRSLRSSVTYTFERVKLDTTSLADIGDSNEISDLYNKSSVMFGLTWDNSTPVLSPTQGLYIAGAFKISGLGLGSDYHFTRSLFELRRYQPVLGMVLAARVRIGGIRSSDTHGFVPVEDRFFSGGSASVRGWARAELGPVENDIPVGGESLLEGSLELRHPIWGILSGAMFVDGGNVWLQSYRFPVDDLRYSAGLGLRVKTPIGAIRVDVARPVFDDEATGQVHISVGEAF